MAFQVPFEVGNFSCAAAARNGFHDIAPCAECVPIGTFWLVEPIGETNQHDEARIINSATRPEINNPDWYVSGPYASDAEAAAFLGAGESL